MENFEMQQEQKFQEDFFRLEQIVEILRSKGLNVIDRNINIEKLKDPMSEIGFPIVRDGRDGIRASYSKREGIKIWFTNGFEDPDNPKRQEIENRLREDGLM